MNAPVASGGAPHASPTAALVDYEIELGAIAADANELAAELSRLRSHASDLGRAVAERDESIAGQQRAIALLDGERARLRECVSEASEALRGAQARMEELDRQVVDLSLENQTLRSDLAERERSLGHVREAWRTARDLLAEQGRRLARESSERQHALLDAERLRSRVKGLEVQLPAVSERSRATPTGGTTAEDAGGHVRLVATPRGYRIVESSDGCPAVGDVVDVDGVSLAVVRVGPSPLPSDHRSCVFLSSG